MGDFWTVFCTKSDCSDSSERGCSFTLVLLTHPSSCFNHGLSILFDLMLLLILLFTFCQTRGLKLAPNRQQFSLQLCSAIVNGCLGAVYISAGFWILEQRLKKTRTFIPLHWWVLSLLRGFTLIIFGVVASGWGKHFPKDRLKVISVLFFLFAGIFFALSLFSAIIYGQISFKIVMDMSSFIASVLLLLCTYKCHKCGEGSDDIYTPMNEDNAKTRAGVRSTDRVTPFANARLLSRMSFWWLNPLMKKGRVKTLDDEDIPELSVSACAEYCYLDFFHKLNTQKQSPPSILKAILLCHQKEILVSGFFALLKVLCLSAGPLLLNAFIRVCEGKKHVIYEGYVLAACLFFAKSVESLSQRQWNFRSRLVGLKIRSLLMTCIYKKQLRLSNRAKLMHSAGEIINYATVDAYRIGEFSFWFHQSWTTSLQLCIALAILFQAVGIATFPALVVIILTVLCNMPLARLQHEFQTRLMGAQDNRLKACSEALLNMKVLKFYAWETHFKNAIENLRKVEYKWLSAVQLRKAYNSFLFWSSPILVSTAAFGACYFLKILLHASNVFTFVATLRLLQDPIRTIPDVVGAVIQAKVAFSRICNFLDAHELPPENLRSMVNASDNAICIKSADFSWQEDSARPTLRNISLVIRHGEKVAICGEVGSGKSTILAAILAEVPSVKGTVQVNGHIAYVSQSAWIQTGTIQENILFGLPMETQKYQCTLDRCSLVKDLEMMPHGDLTQIGERGVNLSGGQKQRIQLARALYQDADIYLLDDPFSAVDAHTAASLFSEFVMEALSKKTVLLVTHQVDFLPVLNSVVLMFDGRILQAAPYYQLLDSSKEFSNLVNAHKETAGSEKFPQVSPRVNRASANEIMKADAWKKPKVSGSDKLIKQEEREIGDTGFKPYLLYLNQSKGLLYFSLASLSHLIFLAGQILQNSWMAANVGNPRVSTLKLIVVYLLIGFASLVFLLSRSLFTVVLGIRASTFLFSRLLDSLIRAPMPFYDSTPLGRILSRVSCDLSIIDLDIPFNLIFTVGSTMNAYSNLGVLAVVTWQVLFVSVPILYIAISLQTYYFASAKQLMRINGTSRSLVANHLAESLSGAMTIRAFKEEERFFVKNLKLIDANASPFFYSFAANEWLIQRLEMLSATILSSSALCLALLPPGTFRSGFIGMALSYGLSLNVSFVASIQNQCSLANYIISVERLDQYMNIPGEAPEVIEGNRPLPNWPATGKVEFKGLQVRYRPDAPLVLHGISCIFEGGSKIGIVGRTGSGKTTLISALFRLVEFYRGKIIVDGVDISKIGLHDLRSQLGIIPQDPTLFNGTVRYNLDPLSEHNDDEIWEVIEKCQLREAVEEKENGLDSLVAEDGSNWSMGQRQLFCLGRCLLRKSRVLVLDEATASIDNATDLILQGTIRSEFASSTVISVAHRIPTVLNCTMVLAICDGKLAEYDEPMKLLQKEGSLFGQLVKEYWSSSQIGTRITKS